MADELQLWKEFSETGSVEAYIKYVNAKKDKRNVNTDRWYSHKS